ncbi:unnamed protein product [Dicrocoelium dendriticum]|nr:unnamed protein product [Dicrocoelium dendriticum]
MLDTGEVRFKKGPVQIPENRMQAFGLSELTVSGKKTDVKDKFINHCFNRQQNYRQTSHQSMQNAPQPSGFINTCCFGLSAEKKMSHQVPDSGTVTTSTVSSLQKVEPLSLQFSLATRPLSTVRKDSSYRHGRTTMLPQYVRRPVQTERSERYLDLSNSRITQPGTQVLPSNNLLFRITGEEKPQLTLNSLLEPTKKVTMNGAGNNDIEVLSEACGIHEQIDAKYETWKHKPIVKNSNITNDTQVNAARSWLPKIDALTAQRGKGALQMTNWSILTGRRIGRKSKDSLGSIWSDILLDIDNPLTVRRKKLVTNCHQVDVASRPKVNKPSLNHIAKRKHERRCQVDLLSAHAQLQETGEPQNSANVKVVKSNLENIHRPLSTVKETPPYGESLQGEDAIHEENWAEFKHSAVKENTGYSSDAAPVNTLNVKERKSPSESPQLTVKPGANNEKYPSNSHLNTAQEIQTIPRTSRTLSLLPALKRTQEIENDLERNPVGQPSLIYHTPSKEFVVHKPKQFTPISPRTALQQHGCELTFYEQQEIKNYPQIWFMGIGANKVHGVIGASENEGYDDDKGGYKKVKHDHLAYRYEVLETLGKGSFGRVVRALDHQSAEMVAIKIIRNNKRFYEQAQTEVSILQDLKSADPLCQHNVVHIKECFDFRNHFCIVFELLGCNFYDFLRKRSYRGCTLDALRNVATGLLQCLCLLLKRGIVHCDLKPENILTSPNNPSGIRVIDFGSSCYTNKQIYTYIQSRFYRAPEVILGLPYGPPIDIWSFGCILPELYMGQPLFPGENEAEQLSRIMEMLGLPPKQLLAKANRRNVFFDSYIGPKRDPFPKERFGGTP